MASIETIIPIAVFGTGLALLLVALVRFVRAIRDGYVEAELADRRWRGRCLACGYSLRGNVSGVCPECGAGVSSPAGVSHSGHRPGVPPRPPRRA